MRTVEILEARNKHSETDGRQMLHSSRRNLCEFFVFLLLLKDFLFLVGTEVFRRKVFERLLLLTYRLQL